MNTLEVLCRISDTYTITDTYVSEDVIRLSYGQYGMSVLEGNVTMAFYPYHALVSAKFK